MHHRHPALSGTDTGQSNDCLTVSMEGQKLVEFFWLLCTTGKQPRQGIFFDNQVADTD